MIIHSEQEMLDFGATFAKSIIAGDFNNTFRDISRPTWSELARSPVTTGATKRVEKGIIKSSNVIELVGDVGAGKTTFVRGLAKGLGITKPITSPSFTISKSYALPNGKGHLIHYDFYRLSDPGLMSNDLADNLTNPDNIIIIEWGESISNLLPPNHTTIIVKKTNDDSREIMIENSRNSTSRGLSEVTTENEGANPATAGVSNPSPESTVRLFLNTASSETILRLNDKEYRHDFGHDLAEQLLSWIHDKLTENHKTWQDITEIEFMSGPGSFTGLRIGASIVNALAHELDIPLKDHHGNLQPIILPEYGCPARITTPRK